MEIKDIISSGLLELYVIGAASPAEAMQVESWRAQYPEIAEELLSIENAMEAYAMANAAVPSPELKNKIVSSISNLGKTRSLQPVPAKVFSISPVWRSVAAASVILFIASSISSVLFYNKYKKASADYNESKQQLAMQSAKLDDMNKDMGVVQSKYSEPVSLKGLEAAPDAAAKIFWMKNTGETYIDPINLPEAPEGMQYQLWAIVDGKPVDGGMILTKDDKKYRIQKMKTFGKVQAFAVTLETKGGNPEPKGKMYVMGEM